MRLAWPLTLLALLLTSPAVRAAAYEPAPPGVAAACDPVTADSAEGALREVLRLWKNEQYEALYERGLLDHQAAIPREDFVQLMRREDRVPQCCWLQLRDVQVACDGPYAYVTSRVGYEVGGYLFDGRAWAHDTAPKEVVETWRLVWQAGAWRVDLYQVLGPSWLYYTERPGIVRRFDFPRFPRITPGEKRDGGGARRR
jgi:hypothetical protein